MRLLLSSAILVLLALPAAAQDAAGKWNATVETPNGPFALAFEFLVDAAGKLTGSMTNELFGAIPIKEGMTRGSELAFKLTFEGGPDGPMTIAYTGTVKGDELALTSKFEGAPPGGAAGEQSFTAKRAQ
jgi:hypothetical protein